MNSIAFLETSTLGGFSSDGFVTLSESGLGLETNITTTPSATDVNVLNELGLGHVDDALESSLILRLDLGESYNSSSLLVNNLTETTSVVDDNVRDTHLTAESGQPNDELNRVDVSSDDNKLGLLVLNEVSNMLQTELGDNGLGTNELRNFLTSIDGDLLGLSQLDETLLLGLLVLGCVLGQELKEGESLSTVKRVSELVDGRGDLETVIEDLSLTLNANVARPANKAGDVLLGVEVVADGEVLGLCRESGRSYSGHL